MDSDIIYFDTLFKELSILNIPCSQNSEFKIMIYVDMLREYNTHINLVGSNDLETIIFKHVLDSAIAFPYFHNFKNEKASIADIGTGAGLPGIILSILGLGPVFLVESKEKKVRFLKQVISRLKLSNTILLHQNVNEITKPMDIITCRAFSTIDRCLKLTKKMRTFNTMYFFYKGTKKVIDEEIEVSDFNLNALIDLRSTLIGAERHLVIGGLKTKKR